MLGIVLRGVFAALGLWIATFIVRGISFDTEATLLVAGLVLGLANAFVRPIFVVLTFPLTVVTLGLFLLVVNALMVLLVGWLMPGMYLSGFWAAFFTAIVVSVVGWIGGAIAKS